MLCSRWLFVIGAPSSELTSYRAGAAAGALHPGETLDIAVLGGRHIISTALCL